MKLSKSIFILVLLSSSFMGSRAAIPSSEIQSLIDAAQPGEEVLIPAGEYHGAIKIKEGVIVRGAGDRESILDGQGQTEAVALGKNAAIIGFNIRNAAVLVHNRGNFAGIFECSLSGFSQQAVLFSGGSGVLAHNNIEGNTASTAILVANANPLIVNNRIALNQTGIQVAPNLIPSITDNLFVSNAIAVAVMGADARVNLKRNIFSGNSAHLSGMTADDENDFAGAGAEAFKLNRGTDTAAYLDLMREAFAAAVGDHPIIVYNLQPEAGAFDAIGLFPWATFTLTASAADTVIETYRAFDILTDRSLNAEYAQDQMRPSVRVLNPQLTEKMRERYVLENRYVHPASYFDESPSRRVFKRLTNVAQIEVVIPQGYEVVSSDPAGQQTLGADQRSVIVISTMGETVVSVVMERTR